MEVVRDYITGAMPLLANEDIEKLIARLKQIGVLSIDDMKFVTSDDVDGILPPIQCRRLIQAFTAGTGKCLLLL